MTTLSLLLTSVLSLVLAATPAPPRAASKPAPPRQVLPWIEDDWTRAVAEAKARKLPIFVESWAPW